MKKKIIIGSVVVVIVFFIILSIVRKPSNYDMLKSRWIFTEVIENGTKTAIQSQSLILSENFTFIDSLHHKVGLWKLRGDTLFLTTDFVTNIDSVVYKYDAMRNISILKYFKEDREITLSENNKLQTIRNVIKVTVLQNAENKLVLQWGSKTYSLEKSNYTVTSPKKTAEIGFFSRFRGIIGVVIILLIAFLLSNNRKAINYRLVISGLALQLLLAFFILKVPLGQAVFNSIGEIVIKMLEYANEGAKFVFGVLVDKPLLDNVFGTGRSFIFVFTLIPTIIFVCVLVEIAYFYGIMQRIVLVLAKGMHAIMRVSGSESLSNISSAFVGQVEAQIMIQPYLATMTRSEILATMTGSMACIAGGVMAVYIAMGVPAPYLLAASLMSAPAALVISKIVYPETEESMTKGEVKLQIKKTKVNVLDSISHGASSGMKVSVNVIAMLVGFIALIAMLDGILGYVGRLLVSSFDLNPSILFGSINLNALSLKSILGAMFSLLAYSLGVPFDESLTVGSLMGTKFVINEFVAYMDLTTLATPLSDKAMVISSFALCGFANFSSIAIQVGGIGVLVPERRADLAKLGFLALICGTLTNYLSAAIAGMML